MPEAVLGLGGNLGARRSVFCAATRLVADLPSCELLARSSLYESSALGPPQPDYLNAALRVRYDGEIEALFAATQRIEQLLGRERRERWGARTIDIDLLYWSEGPVQRAGLQVPHRELASRAFALAPLLDVAPELRPVWAAVLAALHGPPSLAQPSWPALRREGAWLCSDWCRDDQELIAVALELVARSLHPSGRCTGTFPFSGPRNLERDGDLAWVYSAIASATQQGFVAQTAAITAADAISLQGFLVGEVRTPTSCARSPTLGLDVRAPDERRVRILWDEGEDGFVLGGSVTM